MSMQPAPVRLVICDLDGVVYRGDDAVPGVATAIAVIEGRGIMVRYATNNSTRDRAAYVTRLAQMGITTRSEAIVTSTSATIAHLRRHAPRVHRILAIGEDGMVAELRRAGFGVTPAEAAVAGGNAGAPLTARYDAVVVGLDRGFRYDHLAAAMTAIRDGALFVATNADERFPTEAGFLPGAGAAVAALQVATGIEPLVIGKPQPEMFTAILSEAGLGADAALVVGDNPAADMVAARRAGIRSVLVLTGVADRAAAAALGGEQQPDVVADSAAELPRLVGIA